VATNKRTEDKGKNEEQIRLSLTNDAVTPNINNRRRPCVYFG